MREVLIIFLILLVLLLIISTLGGSIKFNEPFYEQHVVQEEALATAADIWALNNKQAPVPKNEPIPENPNDENPLKFDHSSNIQDFAPVVGAPLQQHPSAQLPAGPVTAPPPLEGHQTIEAFDGTFAYATVDESI